jgi:hypothetical protein
MKNAIACILSLDQAIFYLEEKKSTNCTKIDAMLDSGVVVLGVLKGVTTSVKEAV